jgi:integrase
MQERIDAAVVEWARRISVDQIPTVLAFLTARLLIEGHAGHSGGHNGASVQGPEKRTRLDKHILPIFGKQKLDRISVATVERFRNNLRDRKYAYRTINTILRIMSAVFRLGIKRGQCTKNLLDSVERAVQVAKELKAGESADDAGNDAADPDSVLSPVEIQLLLAAARPGFERTLFETAYLTGAREGELLALRWADLELPREGSGKMVIRRSLS